MGKIVRYVIDPENPPPLTNGARSLGVQSGVESADAAGVLMGSLLLFDVLAQDVDWRTATA